MQYFVIIKKTLKVYYKIILHIIMHNGLIHELPTHKRSKTSNLCVCLCVCTSVSLSALRINSAQRVYF